MGHTETRTGVSPHSEHCWLSKPVDPRRAGLPASTLCILERFFLFVCFCFCFLPVASVPLSSQKSRLCPINAIVEVGS